MTGNATARFIQTVELVKCLADEIQNKSQLRSLCLVSKAFHDAFTPALYGEMDIVTPQWGHNCPQHFGPEEYMDMFERLPSNPHLSHVRRLQLDLNHDGPVNEIVRSLVERMPLLEEFEWDGGCLHQETMSALIRSCPRLKSFVMIFVPYTDPEDDMWRDDADEISDAEEPDREVAEEAQAQTTALGEEEDMTVAGMHHLARFAGLTKLTVGQMEAAFEQDGEYRCWAEDVVRILVACPDLEELTLSFSERGVRSDRESGSFFRLVCHNYAKRAARPLRLKVLRLGLGLALRHDAGTGLPVPRISDLTDLSVLEELYVDRRNTDPSTYHFLQTGLDVGAVPWDVFTPDCCPALARIGVFPTPEDLDGIPTALLSLLQLPVDHALQQSEVRRRPRSDSNQVALRLGGFNPGFGLMEVCEDQAATATATVQDQEDAQWEAYLGLAANARSLFLQTSFDEARLELKHQAQLEAMLGRTPGLRVLVLAAPLPVLGAAFHQRSTTVEQMDAMLAANRDNMKLAASTKWRKKLARRLAEAGRGLRVVKIGRHAWRVHRGGADAVQLLSMDRYEQRRLGCFRPPNHAYPEFVRSKVYASFGDSHEYEAAMR